MYPVAPVTAFQLTAIDVELCAAAVAVGAASSVGSTGSSSLQATSPTAANVTANNVALRNLLFILLTCR
jgi:hypothetical protein